MIYAGIDIGTSASKASVFADGVLLKNYRESYPSKRGEDEHLAQLPLLENALFTLLKNLARDYPDCASVAISSFGESFVCLDEKDVSLFPVLLYSDSRGEEQAKDLERKIGNETLARLTGQEANGMFSLPKLCYFAQQDPLRFSQVKKVLLMEDYAVYLLTGVRQIDESLASRTLAFDVQKREWSKPILGACGIDVSLFSQVVKMGTPAGYLKKECSEEAGFHQPPLIVSGAHDQVASALGAGVLEAGDACDGMGSCECLTPVFSSAANFAALSQHHFGVIPYRDDRYVCYGLISTAGALFEWYFKTFFADSHQERKELFAQLNASLKEEPSSLMLLPDFAGAFTPFGDADVRGALLGLSLGSSREEIYQAILEGLCYELRATLECLEASGIFVRRLIVTGGGAANPGWLSKKATILNREIYPLSEGEGGCRGGALLAALAIGAFSSLDKAQEKSQQLLPPYRPETRYQKDYEDAYRRYQKLYPFMQQWEAAE